MNTRTRRENAGKGAERLAIEFGGKTYDTQFTTSTGEKNFFIHDMHKLAMDVTLTQMTSKKGIIKHEERKVAATYKEYTQLEDMNVMGAMDPDSLKISHKKGALRAINLIKEKRSRKLIWRMCAYG